ncbi:MAG: hypothetical protein J5846_06710 [Desulfovibrio sp.]|nr:hypothetical protein [Desulfovibrio sp.]
MQIFHCTEVFFFALELFDLSRFGFAVLTTTAAAVALARVNIGIDAADEKNNSASDNEKNQNTVQRHSEDPYRLKQQEPISSWLLKFAWYLYFLSHTP